MTCEIKDPDPAGIYARPLTAESCWEVVAERRLKRGVLTVTLGIYPDKETAVQVKDAVTAALRPA